MDQVIPVMEMEIVSKKLQVSLHHKFAQVELTVMEMEIVFQIQFQYLVPMDGNLMDKVDVFHWLLLNLPKFHHQDAQIVLLQMELEDAFQDQSCLQYHAQLVSWVTEMETAFLCHQLSQLFHQVPQVHAHAKVLLMNYNQKYQFYKQQLHNSHYQLLNHKLPSDHQIQHPVLQVETQISKLKLKYMPKSLFNSKGKVKTKIETKNEWVIDLLIYCIMVFCLGNTKQNLILKIIFYKSLIL